MAIQYDRKVLIYYGPFDHSKGLVNAKSAFGVKRPLLKAVIIDDFKYNSEKDIYQYIKIFFKEDGQKIYFHVPLEETVNRRCEEIKPAPILGCVKESHHMICFMPDSDCLEGNFLDCCVEKGRLVMVGNETKEDDYSSDS